MAGAYSEAERLKAALAEVAPAQVAERDSKSEAGAEALRPTLAERHPDWPQDIDMLFLRSPHGTEEDVAIVGEVLRRSGAHIYLHEFSGDQADVMTGILQKLADLNPDELPPDYIDRYIQGITVGDKSIVGTALAGEMKAVFGTGVVVGNTDLRSNTSLHPDVIRESYETPTYDEGGFDALLDRIDDSYYYTSGLENERERRDVAGLEPEVERIFEAHPRLREKAKSQGRLIIVKSMGGYHEGEAAQFEQLGIRTEVTATKSQYADADERTDSFEVQARKEVATEARPEPETLARAYFEVILRAALNEKGCSDIARNDDLALYYRRTAGAFSKDEIAAIYQQDVDGALNSRVVDQLMEAKGLPPVPKSYAEMQEILSRKA